jgi:nucleoside-diphosphate-sugar epimerase
MKNPADYNDVNINGILNMLQAARNKKVKRFVFASSSSVYGDTTEFPQVETQYPLAMSPYALTKLAGEYYCRVFSTNFGLETVCLRYFNVFGPKQALDDEYAVVIPKFIDCIIKNEPPPIFGDGGQSRDFTYIENIVSANFLAATVSGITHEVVNIALGENNTVLSLAQTINKILGKNVQPKFLPLRAGDIYKSHANISKIQKVLGYQPLVRFEEGLRRTIEYFQKHNKK